jgi:hypothetical protein
VSVAPMLGPLQVQNLFGLSHGQSLRRHAFSSWWKKKTMPVRTVQCRFSLRSPGRDQLHANR